MAPMQPSRHRQKQSLPTKTPAANRRPPCRRAMIVCVRATSEARSCVWTSPGLTKSDRTRLAAPARASDQSEFLGERRCLRQGGRPECCLGVSKMEDDICVGHVLDEGDRFHRLALRRPAQAAKLFELQPDIA